VKYYNAETRSVLTSRNYHFLDSDTLPQAEQLLVVPDDTTREGESMGDVRTVVNAKPRPLNPRKWPAEDSVEGSPKQITRGKKVDYKHLDDLFSDNEDEAMNAEELLPPQHVAKRLSQELPWWRRWSNEMREEMHRRARSRRRFHGSG